MSALILVEGVAHPAVIALAANANNIESFFGEAQAHEMGGDMVLDTGPDFVRVNKWQGEFAPFGPGAEQEPAFSATGVGWALWVGKIREVVFQVVLINGLQMAGDLARIENLPDAADEREPRAQHSVCQTAIPILVFGPLLFKDGHGLRRVTAHHALVLEWI